MAKVQLFKIIDSVEQTTYPNQYGAVLAGEAYWYPHPIDIKGYFGKFFSLYHYQEFDMDHPRCYNCGRFIPLVSSFLACEMCRE